MCSLYSQKGHLRSSEVTNSFVFANNLRFRKYDVGIVSMRLSRQDASTHMQHGLRESPRDLDLMVTPDFDLRFKVEI